MANNSSVLNLVDIDFDVQKAALVAYLSNQDRFRGYDFAGSDMNVLLDVLAINLQKHAFFTNMSFSEGFIDSAQQKSTIFSHAKDLNYTPRSARSSRANVTVTFQASAENQPYVVQKGQSFSAQIKNQNFIFTIPETLTVSSSNTTFTFTTDVYEGIYVKDSYIFDASAESPSFKINNLNVDTSSLVVNVYEDDAVLGQVFNKTTSLLGLNSSSKVFFLQTDAADASYEVIFGDGVMGYQPKNGSLIVLDYRIATGPKSDGSSVFSINFDPTVPSSEGELTGNINVVTNQVAAGGTLSESVESVRFYAPRHFEVQERAVCSSDFDILLRTQFPEIDAVNAYGGETLTPPQYGKVIVAVSLSNIDGLPQSKQDAFYNFLRPRMMMTEFPIFLEPSFTYIDVTSTINYDINVTTVTDNRIKTLVTAAITDYNSEFLNDFNVTFRYSKFTRVIDDADPSIISNSTDINLCKKIVPLTDIPQTFVLNYDLKVMPLRLYSTNFVFEGEISSFVDDGSGNVKIKKTSDQTTTATTIGSINYTSGFVQINSFQPDSFDGNAITIYVKPVERDISCKTNTILKILPENLKLKVVQVRS
jgi:hypothetical protein